MRGRPGNAATPSELMSAVVLARSATASPAKFASDPPLNRMPPALASKPTSAFIQSMT